MPVGPAKFDVNRCNESPLRGEKPDFWPVSKFYTGSLALCGILSVKIKSKKQHNKTAYMHTYTYMNSKATVYLQCNFQNN